MKKLLLTILLTTPAMAEPVDITLAWDANPPSDNIINYTVYKDGVEEIVVTGTTTQITVDNDQPVSLQLSATNAFSEGEKSDPLVLARPAKVTNVRLQN